MLEEMHASVNRLSRLNKSLILLTRIENREFNETEELPLHEVLLEQITHLHDIMQMHELAYQITALEPVTLSINERSGGSAAF